MGLRVKAEEIDAAVRRLRIARRSLRSSFARDRIEAFHRRQLPRDDRFDDALGVELGLALDGDRGGRALRAGRHRRLSVLGADERGAGQGRRRAADGHGGAGAGGQLIPLVLAAAKLAGIDEIYRIGGAQAVAALAYGTETDRARSPRSSGRATPMSRRPSASSSARSAST